MPLVVTLTSLTAASLPANTNTADYVWGFKNGFWHMINSMSVQYNNGTIIQETPFTNVFTSFKALTEWGWMDVQNDGASTGFYPDNAASWSFADAVSNASNLSASGIGLCNNRDNPSLAAFSPIDGADIAANLTQGSPFYLTSDVAGLPTGGLYSGTCAQNPILANEASYNKGFLKRQTYVNFNPVDAAPYLNQGAINSAASLQAVNRNYKQTPNVQGSVSWSIIAKLRLKDLHDFFGKMPLAKGGSFRFLINTNQSITNFTYTRPTFNANGTVLLNPTMVLNSVSINGGLTNPLMVASAGIGQGCSPLAQDTYNLSVSIYKNNFAVQSTANASNAGLTSCRLYVPLYTFSPMAENNYLSLLDSRKKVVYTDIFQFTQTSIGANQPFNFLVSNGLPNIQFVLVVPLISASGAQNGTCPVSTIVSPFCTTGGTPDPITLTNFNVAISNQNLFEENLLYDYEVFKEQLRTSFQLNGDVITGMTSGLISEMDFSRGMRYYYADASRQLPSDDGVSKSVQVKGTNASNVSVDLLCFIGFKKFLELDVGTGAVLSKSS
jgi:hypothetical protein